MKNKEDLKKELIKIDHKSYGMYKTLGGSYSFGNYILYIDHVQGDPFASPSRLHFEVKRDRHGFPEEYYQEKHRRLALENLTLFTNSVTASLDNADNVSISPKSLEVSYNTIAHPGPFSILVVFVIPVGLIIGGFIVWFRRRRR
mgnify:CR=1 FL=1